LPEEGTGIEEIRCPGTASPRVSFVRHLKKVDVPLVGKLVERRQREGANSDKFGGKNNHRGRKKRTKRGEACPSTPRSEKK